MESGICKSESVDQLIVQRNLYKNVLRMFEKAYSPQTICVGAAVEPRLARNAEG